MSSAAKKVETNIRSSQDGSLVKKVWGLDWTEHFPMNLVGSIEIESLSYHEAAPIIGNLFPEVYQFDPKELRFSEPDPLDLKQRYYEIMGEFFIFRDSSADQKIVGLAAGSLLDWSSYNFRNIAIAPGYQNHGIYVAFFDCLAEILKKYGVRRIEGDVAPSNRHHIHVLNKMGCTVSALGFSERWGVLLHMTRYLEADDQDRCARLFSMTSASDIRANQKDRK
ncbi:MAG: GNAT family N-acetyltransferase [Proteobacteria bacterium]|nr:GNAT family N-acetyltransferase [Pseudomonadota bacterium]